MPLESEATPASAYLLADNLDAALAAGEDLLTCSVAWNSGKGRSAGDLAGERLEQRQAVEAIRSLEIVVVARVLKSRERASELAKQDERLKPVAKLYHAGTAVLVDASNEFGDATVPDFETGDGIVAYLRSRGLIASDSPGPRESATIAVSEDFLIARRIRLGALMDLVAVFLDALDVHYDPYGDNQALALAVLAGGLTPTEART
jgi:hypothetical protein